MTDRNNEELADALARLSAGDIDPNDASHHGHEAEAPPAPAPPPRAAAPKAPAPKPAAPRPPAPTQSAPATAKRASMPGAARPASPARPAAPARPTPQPIPRPAAPGAPAKAAPGISRPSRPAVPGARAPVASGPVRPAVPTAPPFTPGAPAATFEETEPVAEVDDDAVNVPAAPFEYLGHTPALSQRHKHKSASIDMDSLRFRQTTIPIFLTTGVLLLIAGALRFIVGTDSPLSDLPIWIALVVWLMSLLMFGGAAMNMVRIRNQLASRPEGATT